MSAAPYLILIRGGPCYAIDAGPAFWAKTLSADYEGEIWYHGPNEYDGVIGRFRVRCVRIPDHSSLDVARVYARTVIGDINRRRQDLRSRNPIVISYEPSVLGCIGAVVAQRVGGKLVLEVPGTYISRYNFSHVQSFLGRYRRFWRQRLLSQIACARADVIRVQYDAQLRRFVLADRSKLARYFDPGNQLDAFSALSGPKEKSVLFVGYPWKLKGVDVLIAAWRRVAHAFPDWSLTLVGHGIDEILPAHDGARERIIVTGSQNTAQVLEHYRRAQIFVLPSWIEGLPRVLMEAAAARVARIATDVGGNSTIVANEVDGLLIPPGDVEALAAALSRVMADDVFRERLAAGGAEMAATRLTIPRYMQELAEVMARLGYTPAQPNETPRAAAE
jgi:glycosyltransferase involved in cell wall biosynthesis